ncbi:MAG: Flp family type IVb pilin [Pseudomonadota bacterium]
MSTLVSKLIKMTLVFQEKLTALGRDESGASAIEYALIVGLIVGALVGVFATFETELQNLFDSVTSQFTEAADEASGGGGSE